MEYFMKKLVIATLVAMSFAAQATSYVSVDVENVQGRKGAGDSQAQYIRAGKEIGGIQYGLQGRTAKMKDGSGLMNSVELTLANNKVSTFGITPFVGVGHDNGFNGGKSQNYGLIGATTGIKAGPGFLLAGVKTRVKTNASDTQQTVGFATYSIPVTKDVAFNLNASRSGQDIKEKAFGVGLSIGF